MQIVPTAQRVALDLWDSLAFGWDLSAHPGTNLIIYRSGTDELTAGFRSVSFDPPGAGDDPREILISTTDIGFRDPYSGLRGQLYVDSFGLIPTITVNWGDGSSDTYSGPWGSAQLLTHIYATAGTRTVSLTLNFADAVEWESGPARATQQITV